MKHTESLPVVRCDYCGEIIDPVKVAKAGPRKLLKYCSKAHRAEADKISGHFSRMGKVGNESQRKVKQETGAIPGYEHRRDALVASNKERPRRRKS